MKNIFLLGLILSAAITSRNQATLNIAKLDYSKLFNNVRGVAIKAANENLNMIRYDLNYLNEDTLLYNTYEKKGLD